MEEAVCGRHRKLRIGIDVDSCRVDSGTDRYADLRPVCLSKVLGVSHFLGSRNLDSSKLGKQVPATVALVNFDYSDSDTKSIISINYVVNRIALQTGSSV
jgi:hypothetical protein